ncbi:MAG: SIS domain-containing protein [Candidatus Izemoplasmataceae bacterium]|jgi:uncharacterized phosphosugar-binding protein|uniref:SIS domain-containing protein n=1 Tax=Liberiplasma polymorphum TaxID=3374570 RepID=UPI003773DB71
MPSYKTYFDHIHALLDTVLEKEQASIESAIKLLFEATKSKNNLFVFGASHAGIIASELFYRAGGLATINPVDAPSLNLSVRPITHTSKMERLEGYGTLLAEKTPFEPGDVLIAHSVSGRNTVMIDFVLAAKNKGVKVIALTNLNYSKSVKSRHPSNKRLFELADIVIDNHGDIGDASVKFDDLSQKVAPTSTVVGTTIMNSIVVGLVNELLNAGLDVPIFFSANLDDGDAHNQKIFKQYKANIFYL